MRPATPLRLLALASFTSIMIAAAVSACSDAESTPAQPDASDDSSSSKGDGSTGDTDEDGAVVDPDRDAGKDAKSTKDANGAGEAGAECAFNRDCQAALRCECEESTGCFCALGVRGTGQNGVDPCDSGNQCASSLCVEGPTAGESICSDECKDEKDCTGKLPRCIAVFGIPEPICARQP